MNEILEENNLSSEGLYDSNVYRYGIGLENSPICIGALSLEGNIAMLRSVAVREHSKGLGLGKRLVLHILDEAKRKKLKTMYLLTDTAEEFFAKLGFIQIERANLPTVFDQNILVQKACSLSSTVMKIDLPSRKAKNKMSG